MPKAWQVLTERQYLLAIAVDDRDRLLATPSVVILFDLVRAPQPLFPDPLQRAGHKAVLRFDGVILATRALGERCLTSFGFSAGPVMLPLLYNNNYEIAQSKDTVAIVVEMVHDVRIIRIGGKHRTDGGRPWMGDSIGWYEGATLVVETTNFPEATALHGAWKELKVTERFTRVAPHRILYRFKVEDPTVWDRPWSGEYEFSPSKGRIFEYACHEGNYALSGILAGMRADESAAERAKVAGANKTADVPAVQSVGKKQ